MKVGLCYKDLLLGTLDFDGKDYIFEKNLDAKKDFEKYFKSKIFPFTKDIQKSENLFPIFETMLQDLDARKDIQLIIGYGKNDSKFKKLCKLSILEQPHLDYYLKLIR